MPNELVDKPLDNVQAALERSRRTVDPVHKAEEANSRLQGMLRAANAAWERLAVLQKDARDAARRAKALVNASTYRAR